MNKYFVGDLVKYNGKQYIIKEVWSSGIDVIEYSYILENEPHNKNYPNLIPERLLKKDHIYIQLKLF